MYTMLLSPEFLPEEKVIAHSFSEDTHSAFERFIIDGGVNSADLYLCRENEDFSPQSVLNIDDYIPEPETKRYPRSA